MVKTTITELKQNNKNWFSPENKRFFGDLRYFVLTDKDGTSFLIRETNAWTDMFDGVKKTHYRINSINEDLTIGDLFDDVFKTEEEVKTFLEIA